MTSNNIGICTSAMYHPYNRTQELLEFIELNKILGVTKFTFYNESISSDVNCILQHYISEGTVQVLPWNTSMLESFKNEKIYNYGQAMALNDCLYRNMNDFQYLLFIDLDEIIVPHSHDTLLQMLDHINAKYQPSSAYIFRNSFYYLDSLDDEQAKYPLRVLKKTEHSLQFNPYRERSKYIAAPFKIQEVGTHFIAAFSRGQVKGLNIPISYGYVHHYRKCNHIQNPKCYPPNPKQDRTLFKYQEQIHLNIQNQVKRISEQPNCQLTSLSFS